GQFDGVSGYLTSVDPYAGGLGSSFSVLIRVRTTSSIGGTLMAIMDSQTGPHNNKFSPFYVYMGDDGKVYVAFNTASGIITIVSASAINDGNNHNIVVTSGGGATKLYVDNAAVVTSANNVAGGTFPFYWRVGSSDITVRGFVVHTTNPFFT